jgi:uncharacterized protein (TIGR02996 family)
MVSADTRYPIPDTRSAMPDDATFLRLIAAAPHDDAPRLVYADWLEERGDPRGRFIRVQCALASLAADDGRRSDLEQVERHLLAAHGAAWAGALAGRVSGWQFGRGFVEEVTLSAAAFLEHGPTLLPGSLIHTVHLHDIGDGVAKLAACPALARVPRLDLCGNHLGNDAAGRLLASPLLRGVQALDLSFNSLSNSAVQALLDAGPWPRLRELDLRANERISGRGANLLAHATVLPALEHLDLGDNQIDDTGVWHLARTRTLRRLSVLNLAGNPFGDTGVRALARGPLLPRLLARHPVLDLRRTDTGPVGLQALVAGDVLRPVTALWFDGNRLGDAGLTALTATDLPHLRELHLAGNGITDEGIVALASVPMLHRLTLLDLADNGVSKAGVVTLLSSPYRHWRTVFEFGGQRTIEADPEDDAPIPLRD